MSTAIPPSKCPACGYAMDSATLASGTHVPPVPGDYSVCLNCGEPLMFNSKLAMERIPQDLTIDPGNRNMLAKAGALIRQRGKLHP